MDFLETNFYSDLNNIFLKRRAVLMIYHPIWSLLSSLFLTGPWFFSKFTAFNAHIFPLSSFIPLPPMLEPPEAFPILCLCEARACCAIKKGGKMRGQKGSDFFCAGVHETILEHSLLGQSHTQTRVPEWPKGWAWYFNSYFGTWFQSAIYKAWEYFGWVT